MYLINLYNASSEQVEGGRKGSRQQYEIAGNRPGGLSGADNNPKSAD
ncbi:hypothetical protein [Emticicia sp. TH156]|nr:hypothetical protein [Emticicia sp. TH156]